MNDGPTPDGHLKSCLVVTHLPLLHLESKRFGIYRRLELILAAASRAGYGLRVFILSEEFTSPPATMRSDVEQDLLRVWGIKAEVVIGSSARPSALPWLFQQLLGVLSYSLDSYIRALLDQRSTDLLRRELKGDVSLVIAHRLPMMWRVVSIGGHATPVAFDLDDVEHLAAWRRLSHITTWRRRFFALLGIPSVFLAERRALAMAARTFVCSETDARRLRRVFPKARISVVGNAVESTFESPPLPHAPVLLFVGLYAYRPNADAADYFVSEIFPLIRASIPNAELLVVGGAPEAIQAYHAPPSGVSFLGFVPSLSEVYRRSRVVVCPIRYGSGTRVKLVEAACWAKPIVTTTIGAEGLEFEAGVHALFGDTAASFAQQCIALLTDDDLCLRLGSNAQALARERFDRERIVSSLASDLAALSGHDRLRGP